MCPDRHILSVYLDRELLSPWKEKMESHLAECPKCRRRLDAWRRFCATPENSAADETAAMEAARVRVWSKLESAGGLSGAAASENRSRCGASIWRRRVSIPLPAAAAAALALFIALAALLVHRPAENAGVPTMLLTSGEIDAPGVAPFSDLNGVLQYLSGRNDDGDVVIIRLPESKNFISSGDPAIIKAADYRNSMTGKRP